MTRRCRIPDAARAAATLGACSPPDVAPTVASPPPAAEHAGDGRGRSACSAPPACLIAARKTIDSRRAASRRRRAASARRIGRSRTSCSSAPTVARASIRRPRRRRASAPKPTCRGHRSDTIMILRRDKSHRRRRRCCRSLATCGCRSPGHDSKRRINSAYNDGPEVLVADVQQAARHPDPPLRRDRLLRLQALVDRSAACRSASTTPTRDVSTGLNITEPGCHILDGVQALAYARSRHYEEYREDEQVARGPGVRPRPDQAPAAVRQPRAADRAGSHQGRSVRGRPADRPRSGRRCASTTSSTRLPRRRRCARRSTAASHTYSLPVFGKTIGGNAVLLLGRRVRRRPGLLPGRGPSTGRECRSRARHTMRLS